MVVLVQVHCLCINQSCKYLIRKQTCAAKVQILSNVPEFKYLFYKMIVESAEVVNMN